MDVRTIRQTKVTLPGEDPEDLDQVEGLPHAATAIADAVVTGSVWSRAEMSKVAISRSWLVDADLDSAIFDDVSLDRCVVRRCTLIGSRWHGVSLKNVIFENCRLDYATLTDLKVTGPVGWIGCSLAEAAFTGGKLTGTAFDGCKLDGVTFDRTDLHGVDLRGNDISRLGKGLGLKGVILSESQVPALMELFLGELEIEIAAEPN